MVEDIWKSLAIVDSNGMINLKKKLQALKVVIKQWTKNAKKSSYKAKISIQSKLSDIDKILDQGSSNEEILCRWAKAHRKPTRPYMSRGNMMYKYHLHSLKSVDSYDEKAKENEEEEKDSPENIHVNLSTPFDPSVAFITEKVLKFNSFFESLGLVPQSSDTEVVCTKGNDGEVMFVEIIRKNDDSCKEEPKEEGSTTTEGVGVEYFDMFPTRSELH
ncbi:hypothetical protein Tco_0447952 [Tanacetum coccineum]